MMKLNRSIYILLLLLSLGLLGFSIYNKIDSNREANIGDVIDSLNGVAVYHNGPTSNVMGRNTVDGYNLGLKYQCVEFVKRYYYQHYHHKMPDSWGHAKSFFNKSVSDGLLNKQRNLIQYTNPSTSKPKVGDILVYDGHKDNIFGHVAIISKVTNNKIEIVQQNMPTSSISHTIMHKDNKWTIKGNDILGWLRKE